MPAMEEKARKARKKSGISYHPDTFTGMDEIAKPAEMKYLCPCEIEARIAEIPKDKRKDSCPLCSAVVKEDDWTELTKAQIKGMNAGKKFAEL